MPVQGRKRRTKAQIAEDNKILQEAREAQEQAAIEGLQRLATMQADMEEAEEESLAKKAKLVKPRPCPVKKQAGNVGEGEKSLDNANPLEAGAVEGVRESNDDDDDDDDDGKGIKKKTKMKTQKRSKASLKDAINNAQGSLMGRLIKTQGPHVEDKKGKSSAATTNSKFSLAGRIKGWASDVIPDPAVQPKSLSASRSCTTTSALSLAHGPPSSALSSSHATSVSGKTTKSCGQYEATHALENAPNTPEVLVGAFGDKTLDDSQERLDAIVSKMKGKGKQSMVKITTDVMTEDTPDSREMSVETDIDAPMDVEDDAPTEMNDNNSHGDEDARMSEDSESDSSSNVLFHRPLNKKCKLADTKHHAIALEDPLDEDDLEDIKIIETAPTDFVRAANTSKQAVRLTSSTSIGVSKAATPVKPPAKKVKTEKGSNNDKVKPPAKKVKTEESANDDTQSVLVALPGYWIEKRYKSRLAYQNYDLPPQCQDQQWPKHFLTTLYLWAGSQDNLWQFPDAPLVEALQCILDVVYPDLNYKVTAQGSVFGVATQRLAEWRSKFGSTGLAIMIDFFAWNKDTDPQVLGQALMDDFTFIYEDMDQLDSMQAFRSPFMLQLFVTVHLHSTAGHVQVTALKTDVLAAIGVCGVLALCATSLKRAIKCISAGDIDVDVDILNMHPAQLMRKLHTPKTFNKATGKDSTTEHAFSINNCSSETASYLIAIKNEGDIYLRDTTSMARKLLKKLGNTSLKKYLHLNDNSESEGIDKCSMLW
ncbi:hypothetical protein BDR03DRAFT_987648 [Suillus americanus]|nr:hypothetical protein BDR03DRAFT_987648 [Suillus americanus]